MALVVVAVVEEVALVAAALGVAVVVLAVVVELIERGRKEQLEC